ncbi:hypothetical protein ACFYZB_39260 [Streptomyces sp. NPDC001852]|uniref:hypothetical protein n=1 Tax=Streptomyces sp. NPDC001852 TaxID=3364619 RepID=UPI0036BAF033
MLGFPPRSASLARGTPIASEICLAAEAGRRPPDWLLAALDALPRRLADGSRIAGTVERECVVRLGRAEPGATKILFTVA